MDTRGPHFLIAVAALCLGLAGWHVAGQLLAINAGLTAWAWALCGGLAILVLVCGWLFRIDRIEQSETNFVNLVGFGFVLLLVWRGGMDLSRAAVPFQMMLIGLAVYQTLRLPRDIARAPVLPWHWPRGAHFLDMLPALLWVGVGLPLAVLFGIIGGHGTPVLALGLLAGGLALMAGALRPALGFAAGLAAVCQGVVMLNWPVLPMVTEGAFQRGPQDFGPFSGLMLVVLITGAAIFAIGGALAARRARVSFWPSLAAVIAPILALLACHRVFRAGLSPDMWRLAFHALAAIFVVWTIVALTVRGRMRRRPIGPVIYLLASLICLFLGTLMAAKSTGLALVAHVLVGGAAIFFLRQYGSYAPPSWRGALEVGCFAALILPVLAPLLSACLAGQNLAWTKLGCVLLASAWLLRVMFFGASRALSLLQQALAVLGLAAWAAQFFVGVTPIVANGPWALAGARQIGLTLVFPGLLCITYGIFAADYVANNMRLCRRLWTGLGALLLIMAIHSAIRLVSVGQISFAVKVGATEQMAHGYALILETLAFAGIGWFLQSRTNAIFATFLGLIAFVKIVLLDSLVLPPERHLPLLLALGAAAAVIAFFWRRRMLEQEANGLVA